MNRRDLRRTIGAAGATAAVPASALQCPVDCDASKELARPDWKPAFLDGHQNATFIALSDLIIPTTAPPRGGGAGTLRYGTTSNGTAGSVPRGERRTVRFF
jgi:hypothetical protein